MSEETPEMIKVLGYDPEDGSTLFFQGFATNDAEYVGRKLISSLGVGTPFMAFWGASLTQQVEQLPTWDEAAAATVDDNIGVNASQITNMLNDTALQTVPNHSIWRAGTAQPA